MNAGIPHKSSEIENFITISQGLVSITPDADMLPADLIKLADDALYQAKRAGRNAIAVAEIEPPKAPANQEALSLNL